MNHIFNFTTKASNHIFKVRKKDNHVLYAKYLFPVGDRVKVSLPLNFHLTTPGWVDGRLVGSASDFGAEQLKILFVQIS